MSFALKSGQKVRVHGNPLRVFEVQAVYPDRERPEVLLFLVLALISFVLAVFNVNPGGLHAVPLGLSFMMIAAILDGRLPVFRRDGSP